MNCWARYLFYALVGVLAIGHMLAACGQKGPLYLPEPAPQQSSAPQPAPQADPSDEGLEALDDVPEVPSGPDDF